MKRFSSATLLALAALVSCGGATLASHGSDAGVDGSAEPDGGAVGPLGCTLGKDASLAGACSGMACVTCGLAQTCSPASFQSTWSDLSTCQTRTQSRCEHELADPAVKTGAPATTACAAAEATLGCDDFLTGALPTACAPVPGAVPLGGGCGDSAQCASGHCAISGLAGCGECEPLVPASDPCVSTTDCVPGLRCDSTAGGTCAAYANAGANCSQSSDCLPTLVCRSGQCATPLTSGAPCAVDANGNDPCDPLPGLVCYGSPGNTVCTTASVLCQSSECTGVTPNVSCCAGGSYCFEPDIGGSCAADQADDGSCAPADVPSGEAPACLPPAVCGPGQVCALYLSASACVEDGG